MYKGAQDSECASLSVTSFLEGEKAQKYMNTKRKPNTELC